MDSDLNEDSPLFTLTCTSTGGPATTVNWTRDSETVSGGVTVLDDPVTAQYTHTLTVTGRLGGQYQCNVSNNKPSSATANFTVQGTAKIRCNMAVHISVHLLFFLPILFLSSSFFSFCTTVLLVPWVSSA